MAGSIITVSTITCLHCGFSRLEAMPEESCQIRYHCFGCGKALTPNAGDCCVSCSYGTAPCPPIQRERREERVIGSMQG